MFFEAINQFKRSLGQLDVWLDKASAFAESKSFDVNVLLNQRLAPDQFPFLRQVQSVCDTAKFGAARLAGVTPPSNPDTEQTLAELRTRIRTILSYLDTFSAKDFEGGASRVISTPRWEGRTMTGTDYFLQHVQPNFFFHYAHAYAILRHNGVDLGKRDYLGPLTMQPAPKP